MPHVTGVCLRLLAYRCYLAPMAPCGQLRINQCAFEQFESVSCAISIGAFVAD